MYRSRITDGLGTLSRSEWITRPSSSSTSAFWAITRHVARSVDTMLSGSKLALSTSALSTARLPIARRSGVESLPVAAPSQVVQHILRFGATRDVTVLGHQSELEVRPRRHREIRRPGPPPSRHETSPLADRRGPQRRVLQDDGSAAQHYGLGSLGSCRIISPMMFRWICDDPAEIVPARALRKVLTHDLDEFAAPGSSVWNADDGGRPSM